MTTPNAELQSFIQQKATTDEALQQERAKGAKCLHYVGILMLISSLGLLIASALFLDYANKSENITLGAIPIGLFAALLGMVGGLCEYCASRTIVESEAKGCSKSLVMASFVVSFVALGQCVIASGFAGSTYGTCLEDPGPAPDLNSWFSVDFRQCVTYRSEVKTAAIFLVLFGIALGVMSVATIVVYCMYKSSFGMYNQPQLLLKLERDTGAIQHILNMQEQDPNRHACSMEELQQLQGHVNDLQTQLSEAAAIPQGRHAGPPVMLMSVQAKVTTLQQTLNTHIQTSRRPQLPGQPFQMEAGGHGYPGYPMGGQGQPMYYPQGGQGQPPYPQGQGQPTSYPQGQAHPTYYSREGQVHVPLLNYPQEGQVHFPLTNYPQEGQGQHDHYPQHQSHGQAGSQLPPSYATVMSKGHDADTEKNWV